MIIRRFCNSVFIIVISLCAKFVVSNGLRPSDFGSYQTPPFNNDSPVAPSNSGFPDQEQTSFQQQYYQQQYGTESGFNPSTNQQKNIEVSKLTQFLAQGSKVSLSFVFFMLMWRTLHHYEIATSYKGIKRNILVLPVAFLFLGNLFAFVSAFTGGLDSHTKKKRAKAVLNLGKLVEAALFLYNMLKMTVFPSRYVPQEIFIAGAIHNFVIINMLHTYTKLSFGGLAVAVESEKISDENEFYGDSFYSGYDQGYADDSQQQYNNNW